MPLARAYLQDKGAAPDELDWFAQGLPDSLSILRQVRARAEHASDSRWTRKGIHQYVTEFLGIGKPGILPRLAKMLFAGG